jgi:hypothetical protein
MALKTGRRIPREVRGSMGTWEGSLIVELFAVKEQAKWRRNCGAGAMDQGLADARGEQHEDKDWLHGCAFNLNGPDCILHSWR